MIHEMKLRPLPFSQIADGSKTFELRLYDEKRQKIRIGDTIVFTSTADPRQSVSVLVTSLHRFDSFAELYRTLPLLRCGYTAENIAQADPRDMEAYYPIEEQGRHGVLGIGIELQNRI